MIKPIFLETDRLIIKIVEEADYEFYRQQQKDPFLMTYFGGPREDAKALEIFNKILNHQKNHGFSVGLVFLKETQEIIGRAGLIYLDFKPGGDVELAYFILQPYCNKGYATELAFALTQYAFENLGKSKLYATIDPDNISSICVAEKLNMKFEKEDKYETLQKTVRFYATTKEEYCAEEAR